MLTKIVNFWIMIRRKIFSYGIILMVYEEQDQKMPG